MQRWKGCSEGCASVLGLCLPGMECWGGRDTMAVAGSGGDGSQRAVPPLPEGIQAQDPTVLNLERADHPGGRNGVSVPQLWPQEVCDRDGGSVERQSRVLL